MKKIKAENGTLFQLDGLLGRHAGVKDNDLAWCLARNKSFIKQIIEDVRTVLKPTESMQEYDREKMKLLREHGIIGDDGQVVQVPIEDKPGQFKIKLKDPEAFNKALEELNKEHEQAMEDQKDNQKRHEDLMKKVSEVKIYRMNRKNLPKDVLSMDDLFLLSDLGIIYEDEEPEPKSKAEPKPEPKTESKPNAGPAKGFPKPGTTPN